MKEKYTLEYVSKNDFERGFIFIRGNKFVYQADEKVQLNFTDSTKFNMVPINHLKHIKEILHPKNIWYLPLDYIDDPDWMNKEDPGELYKNVRTIKYTKSKDPTNGCMDLQNKKEPTYGFLYFHFSDPKKNKIKWDKFIAMIPEGESSLPIDKIKNGWHRIDDYDFARTINHSEDEAGCYSPWMMCCGYASEDFKQRVQENERVEYCTGHEEGYDYDEIKGINVEVELKYVSYEQIYEVIKDKIQFPEIKQFQLKCQQCQQMFDIQDMYICGKQLCLNCINNKIQTEGKHDVYRVYIYKESSRSSLSSEETVIQNEDDSSFDKEDKWWEDCKTSESEPD